MSWKRRIWETSLRDCLTSHRRVPSQCRFIIRLHCFCGALLGVNGIATGVSAIGNDRAIGMASSREQYRDISSFVALKCFVLARINQVAKSVHGRIYKESSGKSTTDEAHDIYILSLSSKIMKSLNLSPRLPRPNIASTAEVTEVLS